MKEYKAKTPKNNRIMDVIREMGGYIDSHGMLQLKKGFFVGEKVPPHSSLFQKWADMVVAEYGDTGLLTLPDEEGRMVHQLRMYIDRHNITYIREHFKEKGMTDEEALKDYVFASNECGGLNGSKMLREPARFHNKYPSGSSYWQYQRGRENKKRLTPDFHSEFILDREGRFVSQWNVLEEDENGRIISSIDYYKKQYEVNGKKKAEATIGYYGNTESNKIYTYTWEEFQQQMTDTESFNYASSNDAIHKKLDIQPPGKLDPDIRRQIAKEWKSPIKSMGPMKQLKDIKKLIEIKNLYHYQSDKGDAYSKSSS